MAAVVLFFVTGCAEVQRAVPALGPIIARTGINPTTMNVIAAGIPLTAFIGNRVARYLVNDQEKEQVARATVETAATGKPQDVSTSTGARVTTTPAAADAKTKTTRAATDAKTKRRRQPRPMQRPRRRRRLKRQLRPLRSVALLLKPLSWRTVRAMRKT